MLAEQQRRDQWTHRWIETNDVTLHVVQAGPTEGPLVMLLHGFPEGWYSWSRYIRPLTEAGYRVWAPDQRGYNLEPQTSRDRCLYARYPGARHRGLDGCRRTRKSS